MSKTTRTYTGPEAVVVLLLVAVWLSIHVVASTLFWALIVMFGCGFLHATSSGSFPALGFLSVLPFGFVLAVLYRVLRRD